LSNENQSVRLWAACHLLSLEEESALAALRNLAARADTWQIRSAAEITATEWMAGRLDPDWFMKR
jgi:HEAT repeat protein